MGDGPGTYQREKSDRPSLRIYIYIYSQEGRLKSRGSRERRGTKEEGERERKGKKERKEESIRCGIWK